MRRRVATGLCALVLVTVFAVLSGVWFTPACRDLTRADAGPYDLAIILGAGMEPDGRLHKSALGRVDAGVALYHNGLTARLHTTGGTAAPGGPAAGAQMALYAQSLGVGADQITHEVASQSTLQNALFSKPFVVDAHRIILVTEGFHLIRSWLSFRWAGIPVTALCHSTGLRQSSLDGQSGPIRMLAREGLAFWFNIARAGLWSGANALGIDGPRIDGLLY
jgi:uncharacterized SAM-binding protein YcdF (DUF218 family)